MKTVVYSQENIPIKFFTNKIDSHYSGFEENLRLIYILKGSAHCYIDNIKYDLNVDDYILINSFETSNIFCKNSIEILEIYISSEKVDKYYNGFSFMNFWCYSQDNKTMDVKNLISKFFGIRNSEDKTLLVQNLSNEFCLYLINNCRIETNKNKDFFLHKDKLLKILSFMEKNYMNENLTISDFANYIGFSESYTIKIFKETFNSGIINYLNQLRIIKSLNELLYSKKSIIEIAIENGFNNRKTYHRQFQILYNTSPGEYRKTKRIKNDFHLSPIPYNLESKFLNRDNDYHVNFEKIKMKTNYINIDMAIENSEPIKQVWSEVLSLGRASNALNGDLKKVLSDVNLQLKFKYAKFYDIFDEKMGIFNNDSDGNVFYNYTHLDELIDFLLTLNLKPFINLVVLPKKILKDPHNLVILNNDSSPILKNLSLWFDLIKNLFIHLLERYGEKTVSLWYFELWNNYDLKSYWSKSEEAYFTFFKETFLIIKDIYPNIKIGGFSNSIYSNQSSIKNFIKFLIFNGIQLDFISLHFYNIDIDDKNKLKRGISKNTSINTNQTLIDFINLIKKEYNLDTEIIIGEWNFDSHFLNNMHDSCFKSSYIVDTILNMPTSVNKLVYWTLIDRKEYDVFHGGTGLLTYNFLKKPAYNAFLLLNKLGNTIISQGKNYIVTKNSNEFQILFYNYENEIDRAVQKKIHIKLQNIPNSIYHIKKYYLNSNSGSTYDAWMNMNSPRKFDSEIFDFLKTKETMNIFIEEIKTENELVFNEVLNNFDIVLCQIKSDILL